MNELKPEDVMRALECCSNLNCDGCPFDKPNPNCISGLPKEALALLRGYREKNEWLNKEVDRLSQVVLYHDGQMADKDLDIAEKDAEIERLKVRLNGLWEANDLLWDGGRKVCHEAIAAYTEMAKRRLPIISPSVFDSLAKELLEGKK